MCRHHEKRNYSLKNYTGITNLKIQFLLSLNCNSKAGC